VHVLGHRDEEWTKRERAHKIVSVEAYNLNSVTSRFHGTGECEEKSRG